MSSEHRLSFPLRLEYQLSNDSFLQRLTLICGRGERISSEEILLPRTRTVHDHK
jgi:hypothetical protein